MCLSADTWYLKIQAHSRTSRLHLLVFIITFTSALLQKITIHICQIWQKLPNSLSQKTRITTENILVFHDTHFCQI